MKVIDIKHELFYRSLICASYAIMQLCSSTGQSWDLIICEVKFARRWAHFLTACHIVHLISVPPSQATRLPRRLPLQAVCLPLRLLTRIFRLLACPSACLADFFRLLACSPGCLPEFSGCLPDRLTGCRTLEVACPPPCLPGLKAACLPLGLLALPGSPVASRDPIAHCCLCQYARLSCVVSRVVFSFFIRCQLLPHPHVGLALRLVQMNCF